MSPILDLPDDSTSSPSDESPPPEHSGSDITGALPAIVVVATLLSIAAISLSIAGCFYYWRKRSKSTANGISNCSKLHRFFHCCNRALSSDSGSKDSSEISPPFSQPLLPQSSQGTTVGDGTTTADGADSQPNVIGGEITSYVPVAAHEINEASSSDVHSSHVDSEHDRVAAAEIHFPTNQDAGKWATEGLSNIFNDVRHSHRSSSFSGVDADYYDYNGYGKSAWTDDSRDRTMSASCERQSPLLSTFDDSPDFFIGEEEEQLVEDNNRNYDFSLRLVGTSNRPGPFLGIPGPVSLSPIRAHVGSLPVGTVIRHRPPTPLPWSLGSSRHLDTSSSIIGNDSNVTQLTGVNVFPTPKQCLRRELVDMTEYAITIATQVHRSGRQSESSAYSKEENVQQDTDQTTNADIYSGAKDPIASQAFASSVNSPSVRSGLTSGSNPRNMDEFTPPDRLEHEPEIVEAGRNINIMSAILRALREDPFEFVQNFVYSDDEASDDDAKKSDSSISSSPSRYSSDEMSGCTPGKPSSLSASRMSSKGSALDQVVTSPDVAIAFPFIRIHRRTSAVFIRIKYKEGHHRTDSRLSFEDVFKAYSFSAPKDTKWVSAEGMIIVKVFVPETDDIWKLRVPEDISLQRFTSRVLSKLGFHVAFSGSCFDGPEYYFRTDETFRCWIDKRIRNGRNLPIVSHVIHPPLSPRSSIDDYDPPSDTTPATVSIADIETLEVPPFRSHRATLVRRVSSMADIFPCHRS